MKLFRFLGAAVFAVFLLTACGGGPQPIKEHPALSHYSDSLDRSNIETTIHDLINRERTKRGLSKLKFNSTLTDIARLHSQDMGRRGYFSHDTPEGRDFMARYKDGGFSCSISVGNIFYTGAENIAMQYIYSEYTVSGSAIQYRWRSEENIAREVVKGWMNSKGHRQNILTPHWRTEGIGIFIKENGEVLITQNFC